MKGLNVPQQRHKSTLDVVFDSLAEFLVVDEDSDVDLIDQFYNKLDITGDKFDLLIDKSFQFIFEIQELSNEFRVRNANDSEKSNLISISLHDLKHFNGLINFIIIQLIYPLLPIDIGIPLNQRRLKSFNSKSKLFNYKRVKSNNALLIKLINNFKTLFKNGGDVKDLLVKGTGLIDIFTILIVLIEIDSSFIEIFDYFESQSDTYNLFSIYTLLLQSTTNLKYKAFISNKLSLLTINRSNGVISLIDFIIGIRDDEDINIEKFNTVNKVLLSIPKSVTKTQYFQNIFGQIYEILIFIDRPVLLSVALNFISKIYKLNKKIVHDFLFKLIWDKLNPEISDKEIIVTEKELNDAINVLISLTKESSIEFLNELFYPIFLNLWCYLNYLKKRKLEYHQIILKIFTSFFRITKNNEFLNDIILNLVKFQINDNLIFVTTIENNLTSIRNNKKSLPQSYSNEEFFNDIELSIDLLIQLLKDISDDELIRDQFIIILNRWILKNNSNKIINDQNPFIILIDLKLLEKLNDVFKNCLLDKPEKVLITIKNILIAKSNNEDILEEDDDEDREADSDDEDEDPTDNLNILLELLSAIISETNPILLKSKYEATLTEISKLLLNFNNKYCHSLNKRIDEILKNESSIEVNDELSKDKELFEKALINMNDPLVPIRAHGLYLLRQLIIKKSDILSIDNVIELHLLQLQDTEPFIYLNVIKSLNELLELNEIETLQMLMNYYFKNDESLDNKLKIGEVLLNFIQRKNELLISNELIDELIYNTIKQINNFEIDNKLRMSSMSILGESLRINALGLMKFIKDSLDCAIGILELEKDITMKRSSIVLINDLVLNDIELIPKGYPKKIMNLLNYLKSNSNDYLLIEQINKTLLNINDQIKLRFNSNIELPDQFKNFKIIE